MTKKRWIVLAGLLAACVCLTLAVLAMRPARPGITRPSFERIKIGMTLEDVEKILGCAACDAGAMGLEGPRRVWIHPHNETTVVIYFDRNDRVTSKSLSVPVTFLKKLQRWLGLRDPDWNRE